MISTIKDYVSGVGTRSGESNPMARSKKEDSLVGASLRKPYVSRSRDFTAENISRMRNDDGSG